MAQMNYPYYPNQNYQFNNVNPNPYTPQYMGNYNARYSIAGRRINNIEEVMVNEVPIDGSLAVFIKEDRSSIFTKEWEPDGLIRTLEYRLYTPNEETVQAEEIIPQTTEMDYAQQLEYLTNQILKLEQKVTDLANNISSSSVEEPQQVVQSYSQPVTKQSTRNNKQGR